MGITMANKKQLEIFKRGSKVWNRWRTDNIYVEIDLSEVEMISTDLEVVNLKGANLRGANLSGAFFSRADLSRADLRRAHLIRAKLRDANLREADLRDADLTEADLTRAIFRGANLAGANLMGANLIETDLTWADLWKTIFTEAHFGDTDLGSTNLSKSPVGLEKVDHVGPSIVGIDTIRNSKGKIPIEFLRGCGLSDLEIESAKLVAPGLDPGQVTQITYEIYRLYCDQPIQFYSCFISYNSKDHKFAQRLHDDLQNHGVRCWFASEDLKIGDEFRRTIGQEIRIRDKLLIILSKNSIGSEWVGDEVEKALAEEKEQGSLKLFPVRLDSAVLKTQDDWAEKIRLRRHIGDFSGWKDEAKYKIAFERLLKDLKPQ